MRKYTKPSVVVMTASQFVKASLECSHKCGNGSNARVSH